MSIQETKSVPNVYKTEKFVIIDTIDTYGNDKLASTKPNLLECVKVYTAFDGSGNIREFIDTGKTYKIAVPLNLWQVDPSASNTVDEGSNSLICPPYICSNIKMLSATATLSLQIRKRKLHRGSIVYATKRDSGIDVFGHETRSGIYVAENVDYIDINADGRSLKISSQSNKSNNVDLSDSQTANLKNIYDGDYAGRNGGIQNLMNACVINEDAALDYITELDQVGTDPSGNIWVNNAGAAASAPHDSARIYGLVFDHDAGSSGNFPVLKFQEQASGGGGASTFAALSDTASLTDEEGKLLQVNSSANAIEYSNLKASHIDSTDVAATSYFLTSSGAAGSSNTLELKTINQIFGDGYDSVADDIDFGENHYVLVVDSNAAANTKFRRIKYIHQLGGVSIDSSVLTSLNTAEGEDGHRSSVKTVAVVSKDGSAAKYKVRFDEMGDLISDTSGDQLGTGSSVLGEYYVVKNGTDGLHGVKLGADLFSGGGGDGSVRYVDGPDSTPGALQLKRGDTYGGVNYLAYEPKLFGICKENGDYEYRYFLTSVPVTT